MNARQDSVTILFSRTDVVEYFLLTYFGMGSEREYFIPRQPNYSVIQQGITVKLYIMFDDT